MEDMAKTTEQSGTQSKHVVVNESPEERAARFAQKFDEHRAKATQMFSEAIKEGRTPWQNIAIATSTSLPVRNGRNESFKGFNALYLMTTATANGYDDPRWISSRDANEMNIGINKGEKATYIETVDYFKRDQDGQRVLDEDGNPVRIGKDEKPIVYLTPMFNAEQLNSTRKLNPIKSNEPKTPDYELAEKIISRSGLNIETVDGCKPTYDAWKDKIVMPSQDSFASKEGYYAEVLHQIAHATGHVSREGREGLTGNPKSDAAIQENLRGEIASFFILAETGFKLEESHHKDHEEISKLLDSCYLRDDGSVYNKHMFAIVAGEASRMAGKVIGLGRDKEQELSNEHGKPAHAPENVKEQDQAVENVPEHNHAKTQEEKPRKNKKQREGQGR